MRTGRGCEPDVVKIERLKTVRTSCNFVSWCYASL